VKFNGKGGKYSFTIWQTEIQALLKRFQKIGHALTSLQMFRGTLGFNHNVFILKKSFSEAT